LPGVRQPVKMHKMGKVVPIGDSTALAQGLLEVLAEKQNYACDPAELRRLYDPETVAAHYEELFARLRKKK
jgi:hypothetical protein